MSLSWKLYRKNFNEEKTDARINEALFVLGVDLGNHSSSIAYFDINRLSSETIDISGGYGKASMPTALQYVKETREWVYGEYALLNRGLTSDSIFTSLLDKLAKNEYIDVGGRPQSAETILGIYLKELIGNCKNINPKAEIAGITLTVPSYINDDSKNSLISVFKKAGFEKSLITLEYDRDCIFTYYFQKHHLKAEKVVLLDFGSRELRGGIYEIIPGENPHAETKIISVSSLFDKKCGTDGIEHHICSILTDFYCTETKTSYSHLDNRIKEQIAAFSYQHKDLLFQKNITQKAVKLYYNFIYPPIVHTITGKMLEDFVKPYKESFTSFLQRLFSKSIFRPSGKDDLNFDGIDTVICTGGGFEMLWARNAVSNFFKNSNVLFFRNSKSVAAEGASIRSAEALNIIEKKPFYIEDIHKLKIDIGVYTQAKSSSGRKEKFFPIIERNTFWWQNHDPVSFIFNEETKSDSRITLICRNELGETRTIGDIPLNGLPPRPAGTTRLNLWLEFPAYNILSVTVRDMGFGEMFPFADFDRKAEFYLNP